MPQVKIYSIAEHLADRRDRLMAVLNDSFLTVMGLTPEKIVYRFFPMNPEDLRALGDRSERFTVIEIAVFAGRSVEVKTQLIETIFVQAEKQLQLTAVDLEIMLWEIPPSNYGLRGTTGEKSVSANQ
jgi:phenylpyruvate tautomerase PptA (4-oxalocrotonate tautomerase family)